MAAPPYPQAPVVDRTMAIAVLIINIFVPGVGTIVAGILGGRSQIGKGLMQLLLSFILIGWIWALVTSIQVIQNAAAVERRPHAL